MGLEGCGTFKVIEESLVMAAGRAAGNSESGRCKYVPCHLLGKRGKIEFFRPAKCHFFFFFFFGSPAVSFLGPDK